MGATLRNPLGVWARCKMVNLWCALRFFLRTSFAENGWIQNQQGYSYNMEWFDLEASGHPTRTQPATFYDRQGCPKLSHLSHRSELFPSSPGMEALIYMGIPVDELLLDPYKDRAPWHVSVKEQNQREFKRWWSTFQTSNKGSLQTCWKLHFDAGALCSPSDFAESSEPCEASWLFEMRLDRPGKWFHKLGC